MMEGSKLEAKGMHAMTIVIGKKSDGHTWQCILTIAGGPWPCMSSSAKAVPHEWAWMFKLAYVLHGKMVPSMVKTQCSWALVAIHGGQNGSHAYVWI
jgi:hypothetical protein